MRYIWWCEDKEEGGLSPIMGNDWIDNCIPHIDWPRRPRSYDIPGPEELEAMHKNCGWRALGPKVFIQGPLMSEDGDWFAFSRVIDKRRVVCDLLNEYAPWFLDDFIWVDDDDNEHGRMEGLMSLWRSIEEGAIRPTVEGEFGFSDDWWLECPPDHPNAHLAWIVKFDI
jgi:hypothetical protein